VLDCCFTRPLSIVQRQPQAPEIVRDQSHPRQGNGYVHIMTLNRIYDLIFFLVIKRVFLLSPCRSVQFLIDFIPPLVIQVLNLFSPRFSSLSRFGKQLRDILIDPAFDLLNRSLVPLFNNA
jgi:hypothetical protein